MISSIKTFFSKKTSLLSTTTSYSLLHNISRDPEKLNDEFNTTPICSLDETTNHNIPMNIYKYEKRRMAVAEDELREDINALECKVLLRMLTTLNLI